MKVVSRLPDLKKLQHAIVLADFGSYARACEQLCITQSALTRSIQALERELGMTLFDRSTRVVKLTADGEYIVTWAKELVSDALALTNEIARLNQADVGSVAFGVGPAMPSLFLTQLLHDICKQHPYLSVNVTIDTPATLLELLTEDHIEFFISETAHIHFKSEHNFIVQNLASLDGGLYVRSGHPLAEVKAINPAMLSDYTLATTQVQQNLTNDLQTLQQISPHRVMCNDLGSLKHLMLNSDVVLVGLEATVADELEQGRVCKLKLSTHMPFRPCAIGLVRRRNRTPSRPAKEIELWLASHFSLTEAQH